MLTIASGVKPGDRIAVNLPSEVTNGGRIQAVTGAQ